jgi:nitroreductase
LRSASRRAKKAFRSPLLLLVDAARCGPEVDLAERLISAGAAVQNMLLVAAAQGFGSALTSGKALKSALLRRCFALTAAEHAVCFISISIGSVALRRPARPPAPGRGRLFLHPGREPLTEPQPHGYHPL